LSLEAWALKHTRCSRWGSMRTSAAMQGDHTQYASQNSQTQVCIVCKRHPS